MQIEIQDLDYTPYIHLLGTAHFTQRSVREAGQAVKSMETTDLAIELDMRRFSLLNKLCVQCTRKEFCSSKCEFVVASDALGNIDANIWLIDMSTQEIRNRITKLTSPWITHRQLYALNKVRDEDLPWLWEQGFKDEVIQRSNQRLEALRRTASPIWRVLIEERNALMAARLAAIASNMLDKKKQPNLLSLVGAAHVKGINRLLQDPISIQKTLRELELNYSQPTLVRRVQIGC